MSRCVHKDPHARPSATLILANDLFLKKHETADKEIMLKYITDEVRSVLSCLT